MTAHPLELTRSGAATNTQSIILSVLIPFYGDDPRPLLASLAAQAQPGIEIILFDDGAPDAALSAAVTQAVIVADAAVTLITSPVNQGRSRARNALANAASGDWLLFLDADMEISPGFLSRWRASLKETDCDALFGGYAPCEPRSRHERVHAALAHASDAVDAGADVLVAGSYIFRAGDAAEAVAALREAFPPEASPQGKRWPWQR